MSEFFTYNFALNKYYVLLDFFSDVYEPIIPVLLYFATVLLRQTLPRDF